MRRALVITASLALVWAPMAFADMTTAQNNVRQCMQKTGAPGAYRLPVSDAVPQVSPHSGGTQQGAQYVNDCLLDVYQVQFAAVGFEGVSTEPLQITRSAEGVVIRNNCGRGSNIFYRGSGYCRD